MDHPSPPPAGRPTDRRLGARLAFLRRDAGLSQHEVAQGLGLTAPQIDAYERGESRLTRDALYSLCQVLRRPVADAFDGWDQLAADAGDGGGQQRPAPKARPDDVR